MQRKEGGSKSEEPNGQLRSRRGNDRLIKAIARIVIGKQPMSRPLKWRSPSSEQRTLTTQTASLAPTTNHQLLFLTLEHRDPSRKDRDSETRRAACGKWNLDASRSSAC